MTTISENEIKLQMRSLCDYWKITSSRITVSQKLIDDVREMNLKESYEQRIKNKLVERFPINLQIKYSTEGNKYQSRFT